MDIAMMLDNVTLQRRKYQLLATRQNPESHDMYLKSFQRKHSSRRSDNPKLQTERLDGYSNDAGQCYPATKGNTSYWQPDRSQSHMTCI